MTAGNTGRRIATSDAHYTGTHDSGAHYGTAHYGTAQYGTARYSPDPHAHPGLHAIAIFEAAKGLLALLAASGLELLGPAPLQRWLHELTNRFQLDPDHGAFAWLSQTINPDSVHLAAAIGLGYAGLRFLEAWGLWRVRTWASWLGCIGAAVYLPFDVYAVIHHSGWLSQTVLVVNVIVVWVLARDLFKRRH